MKINGEAILAIKPLVLFRATNWLLTRKGPKVGLQISNLEDVSMYEFKGPHAHLWLLLDGVRTVDEMIHISKREIGLNDRKYDGFARKFLEELIEAGLVYEVMGSQKRDERADDMKDFLKRIKNSQSEKSPRAPPKPLKTGIKERKEILKVHRYFSSLFKGKVGLKIKKYLPSAARGRVHFMSSEISFSGHEKGEAGMGSALTVEGAALAATGEAMERTVFRPLPDVYSKSFNDLKKSKYNILDPESFQIYATDQAALRNKEIINPNRDTELNWTFFENAFFGGQKTLIPSVFNASLPEDHHDKILFELIGSGCAVFTDPATAMLKATLELIERDHVLFYWRTRNVPLLIDLSKPDERVEHIINLMGEMKKRIKFYYLKSDLSTVTVQAILLGRPALGEPRFASGSATGIDVYSALEKSLVELLYVTQIFITTQKSNPHYSFGQCFDNTLWDPSDRLQLYGLNAKKEAYRFMFPEKPPTISFADIRGVQTGDSQTSLDAIISNFKRNGLRLYFRDNTPPPLRLGGFFLFRAFSPDLLFLEFHHRFRALGQKRYYTLAAKLGLKERPRKSAQLSPWPHPIP